MQKVFPIIMAGGSGTRLWPLSRETRPKQLLKLYEERSLIEEAIERCAGFSETKPYIVAKKEILEQIQVIAPEGLHLLAEPEARGTAAAIFYSAIQIFKEDPNSVMVVLTADQKFEQEKFSQIIKKSINVAEETDKIILLGIKPTHPETGYGYIKIDKKTVEQKDCFLVDSFIEKPNKERAEKFIKSGDFYWNSGMFVAKSKVFIEEIKKFMPELYPMINLEGDELTSFYKKIENVSIDYGVLEKTKNIIVTCADLEWCDLGSWRAVYDLMPKSTDGNHYEGSCIDLNNKNTMIVNRSDRLIAGIGLNDIIIVDTEDATLVCDGNMTQEVKKVVEEIKNAGRKEHLDHKTTSRPWGRYTILDEGIGFKVKFIHVGPGQKLSLQSHKHRSEHWVVVKGTAKVTIDEKELILSQNESTFVPANSKHRLENPENTELTIVEVQSGSYLEEDDIIRYDDIYMRSTNKTSL